MARGYLYLHHKLLKGNEYYKKAEVEGGKFRNVATGAFGVVLNVFAEGDKAGKRGNKRAYPAHVHAYKQLRIVAGEPRKQYRRRDVAYALAGKRAEKQCVF